MTAQVSVQELHSPFFREAKLRSEWACVAMPLAACAALLSLLLICGALSLAASSRGEAWPFAFLLAIVTACDLARLSVVAQAIIAVAAPLVVDGAPSSYGALLLAGGFTAAALPLRMPRSVQQIGLSVATPCIAGFEVARL